MRPPTHKTKILLFNFVHQRYTFGVCMFSQVVKTFAFSGGARLLLTVPFEGGGRAVVSLRQSCPRTRPLGLGK